MSRGRRRLATAAAVGLCLIVGGGAAVPPAWALPGQGSQDSQGQGDDAAEQSGITIEVEAGIGGWVVPGQEYPLHVTVATDRLIDGVLKVRVPDPSGEAVIERDVEISGGSTARIDLLAPAWPNDLSASRAELFVDGEDEAVAAGEVELRAAPDDELVGLLPDVVAGEGGADALPTTVPVAAELGDARPVPVDTNVLELGALALAPLDQLVVGADELAALPDDQQRAVAGWVQSGGQLLLMGDADALDAAVGALPVDWVPKAGGSVIAGLGRVRSVGDDWTEGLLPSPTRAGDEQQSSGAFAPFSSFQPLSSELGEGAGLRLPGGMGVALLLAGYVLVCGPVVYLVMRRLDRRALAWVAIPVLAVGSTGITFQTGSSLRKAAGSAQVTVYESGPAGTTATSWSLLANPKGGEVGVELPAGWLASGSAAADQVVGMRLDPGTGGSGPSPVRLDTGNGAEGSEALVDSEVAGYGMVEARGPVDGMDSALEVEATVDADGVVSGTVRNELDVDLDDVVVFVGHSSYAEVGTVRAGDTEDFTVENPTAFTPYEWPDSTVWPESAGMDVPGVIVRGGNVQVGAVGGAGLDDAKVIQVEPDSGAAGGVIVSEDGNSISVQVPAEPSNPEPTTDVGTGTGSDEGPTVEAEARQAEAGGGGQPAPPDVAPVPLPMPGLPGDGSDAADDSVILSAWAATQQRAGSNYRPVGQAVAVGWTTELDAPAQPSSGAGPTKSSYSAVVARTTIAADGTELAGSASVRSLVRTLFGEVDSNHDSGVWAFELPATVDGEAIDGAARDLVLEVGTGIDRLEVWTPDGWEVVHNAPTDPWAGQVAVAAPAEPTTDPTQTDPSDASGTRRLPAQDQGQAPAQDQGPTTVDVPPEAVVDGVVLCRWSLSLDFTGGGTGEVTIHDKEASR
jgi:hypothetical protein